MYFSLCGCGRNCIRHARKAKADIHRKKWSQMLESWNQRESYDGFCRWSSPDPCPHSQVKHLYCDMETVLKYWFKLKRMFPQLASRMHWAFIASKMASCCYHKQGGIADRAENMQRGVSCHPMTVTTGHVCLGKGAQTHSQDPVEEVVWAWETERDKEIC